VYLFNAFCYENGGGDDDDEDVKRRREKFLLLHLCGVETKKKCVMCGGQHSISRYFSSTSF
jgi:hypothetical protein